MFGTVSPFNVFKFKDQLYRESLPQNSQLILFSAKDRKKKSLKIPN